MSGIEKLNGLMNAVRAMSGTTGKLSLNDATNIASSAGQWGVRVPNLVTNSSTNYQSFPGNTGSYRFCSFSVKAGTKYSASICVKGVSDAVNLNIAYYDSNWKWIDAINGSATIAYGDEGILKQSFVPTQNGYMQWNVKSKSKSPFTGQYKCLMVNEGDPAPYTSATKPYTVDDLASRLEKLENNLGGGK